MILYNKVKSLYRLFKGCPFAVIIILSSFFSKKKINLVKLFSSKFGHFLVNTEIFLREKYNPNQTFIFFTEDVVDNEELFNLWKKKIFIISSSTGYFLYKILPFLNWKYYDLRNFTFPKEINKFRNKNFLFNIKKSKSKKKYSYFTSSIRKSNYHKLTQLNNENDPDPYQSWRDTNLNNFFLALFKAINKNNRSFLINKFFDIKFLKRYKKDYLYYYKKNYNLEKIFSLILNSKFHLSSSTGIDVVSYLNNIPTAYVNGTLGLGFHSISFSDQSVFCPLNIYSVKEKKIISLKKQVELLKDLQKKFKIDRFEKIHQKYYGIRYLNQTSDEIYNIIMEIDKLSSGKNILNKPDEILQKKFWKIYPNKRFMKSSKTWIFDKRLNRTIISPYFLRKHQKLYLK